MGLATPLHKPTINTDTKCWSVTRFESCYWSVVMLLVCDWWNGQYFPLIGQLCGRFHGQTTRCRRLKVEGVVEECSHVGLMPHTISVCIPAVSSPYGHVIPAVEIGVHIDMYLNILMYLGQYQINDIIIFILKQELHMKNIFGVSKGGISNLPLTEFF